MHNTNGAITHCMVVDDEPMARDVIKRYVEHMPSLLLVAEFSNAIDASVFLQSNHVDIIFLDILMPELNGTDFVRSLHNTPKIIFTSAHKEYAQEGFELDVADYLLKPIRFERFLRAVNKALQTKSIPIQNIIPLSPESKPSDSFIYLRVDRKMVRVLLADILYVESDKDYVKIFTIQGTIITRQTIASVEAMLFDSDFVRIHRSFIVSLKKIVSFTNDTVEIGKNELPIGKLYRHKFLQSQGA